MWVNPSSVGSWQRLFDFGNGQQSDNVGLARVGTTNDLRLFAFSGGTDIGGVTATNVLELNKWQHIAVTISAAGAVVIYKNGVSVATGNIGVPRNITRTSNFLGRSNWNGDALFAGRMDEAAFYDRVLPAADILERYPEPHLRRREDRDRTRRQRRTVAHRRRGRQHGPVSVERSRPRSPKDSTAFASLRIRAASSPIPPTHRFLIVNGGNHYYVNDNSTTNDLFTTAVGNDANSGKSPDQPMASLNALIAAYDLDPGDVVHIDTGTYRVYENMRARSFRQRRTLRRPRRTPTGQVLGATATFNRGNTLNPLSPSLRSPALTT